MVKKLLTIAALILGMGSSTWAQTDVTSTYLTNADFSSGTAIDNNVCTYGKDMETNSTTYYGAQAIDGWTNASVGFTDSDYENCGVAGALFEYGSTPWLAGSGTAAPSTDPDGDTGNAVGLCAVWSGSVQYTQSVTLAAGSYTIRFKVYNATTDYGSGKFITTNLFGFVADGGTTYYAPNRTFAIGQWSTVAVTFNLTEETTGKISMGYVGPSGNANMPHLFVDNVKILQNTYYEDVTSKVGIAAASWTNATDGLKGTAFQTSDGRSAQMAARYGTSDAGTVISQTVTGLGKGSYEAVVYAYSMNEWSNSGATLANDAGNVGYVSAAGETTVTEWINARQGTHSADDYGIYTLSGIEVGDEGELTLAYILAQSGQTEWHAIQIQSLIYTKNLDLTGLISAYEAALVKAKTVDQTAIMAASILSALQTAISTYDDGEVDETDQEALETATYALNTATSNATASITAYASAKTALEKKLSVINTTNFYTEDAYNTFYGSYLKKYDDRSLTTDEAEAIVDPTAVTGWHATVDVDEFLMSTFDVTSDEGWSPYYINTWSTEGSSDGSGMTVPFFEYFAGTGGSSTLASRTITATKTGLDTSKSYKVSALVRVFANDATGTGVTIQVGDGTAVDVTNGTACTNSSYNYGTYSAIGQTDSDGKLTFKFIIADDNNIGWLSFKNVVYEECDVDEEEKEAYEAALANAKAVDQDSPMNATILKALQDALSTYVDITSGYSDAAEALTTATSNATTSISNYATALTYLNAASSLDDAGKASYAADETVAAVQEAYDDRTLEAVTDDQITAMASALQTAAKAQTTAGADMTLAITNWDFENCSNGSFPGWSISAPNGGNTWKNSDTRVEYWIGSAVNGSFDYYQEVTDLPAGKYTLTGGMYNSTNGESGAEFDTTGQTGVYGTSGATTVYGLVTVDGTDIKDYTTDEITVTNGTLRLGVKNSTTMTARWFVVDYIKLTFVEAISLDDYYTQIATYLTTANNLSSSNMEASVKAALTSAIEATEGYESVTDVATLQTYIDNLGTAISNSESSKAVYDNISAYLTVAETAVEGDYSAIETAIENGNYADEDAGVLAIKNCRNAIAVNDADAGDVISVIDNAGFELGNTNYWTVGSSNDTGARSTSNTTYEMSNSEGAYLFNTWWKGIPITQSIGVLPEGYYTLSSVVASDGATIYMIVNDNHDTYTETTDSKVGIPISYTFYADGETEYTIGVVGGANGTAGVHKDYTAEGYWWYKVDDFKLTCGIAVDGTTVSANKYGTFISKIDRTLPEGLVAYTCSKLNGSSLELVSATNIQANTPYILQNTTEADITIETGYAESVDVEDSYTVGLLTGVYVSTQIASGYVLQTQGDVQSFYAVNSEKPITVPAGKVYLTAPESGAKALSINGDVTAIEAINALATGDYEAIYSTSGARLNSLQKGVNIVKMANGKTQKILVK